MCYTKDQRYEYKVLSLDARLLNDAELNRLGGLGWLLVSSLPSIIFVRHLKHEARSDTAITVEAAQSRTLLTIKEASSRLCISRSKFYEYISAGEVSTVRLGRSVRISVSALDDFLIRMSALPGSR